MHFILQNDNVSSLTNLSRWVASTTLLVSTLRSVACGVFLHLEAKRENRFLWIWTLAGLAFQIPAVIAFFAYVILDEVAKYPVQAEER